MQRGSKPAWESKGGARLNCFRALCAPGYGFEDRRPLLRVSGDTDSLIANTRHIGRAAWERTTRVLLATNGEHLALHRNRFESEGDADTPAFEVENLEVAEVDAEGRFVAHVIFDPADRRGAAVEMLERYMRGEGARTVPPAQIDFLRAMQAHDLAAMRAALDDFVFVDHRRTGLGEVADVDQYVASVAALCEQSDDFPTDVLYHVASAEHGSLAVGRTFGTLRESGGAFESVFVRFNRYEGGRCIGAELFELEDLERAKARFEELRAEYEARTRGAR